jgi:sugar lactone lactonase YvrE
MSSPIQERRRPRPARGAAALIASFWFGGAWLAALPSAQAVPTPPGPAGHVQTMGGVTRNYQQGGYGPEDVLATESQFQNPRGLAVAPNADMYITDALNNRVRKIDQNGVVSLVAGNGMVCAPDNPAPCYTGDGGDAKLATLNEPHGVAVDSEGNVYIADSKNCVIRKVDSAGIISTYAGTGARNPNNPKACGKTDGTPDGPALQVALDQPKSLYMTRQNGDDTLWIADMGNSMIRMIDVDSADPQNVRVAGQNRRVHYSDGGPSRDALQADLRHPEGIWVAGDGTIYFTDGGNNLVRKIAPPAPNSSIRKISTIVGDVGAAQANATSSDDLAGNSDGDGSPASNAHIDKPRGISGDAFGNLYVAEEHGSRIRRINLNTGTINTIAGDGTILEQRANGGSPFIKGENGPALETQFAMLHDIQIHPADGSLWIADSRNNRIRAIFDPANAPGANVPTGGNTPPPPGGGGTGPTLVPGKSGYWMLGADGRVYAFGDARDAVFGNATGRIRGGAKAVHIEPTPSARGYWITDDRGGVHAFGDAAGLGGVASSTLQAGERVTSLSRTPSGAGYWVFTTKGRVFAFGDASTFGDLGHVKLNGEIQSSIPTPSGKGYFMVGSDGGVFAFGDAVFRGSMGGVKLNKPVLSLVPTRTNQGYWLVASDGGIFAFGDAGFRGSMGATKLNKPVVGMVRYGAGYLMVAADGGIFSFSDRPFAGSLGANPPARPIVFAATLDS